MRTGTYSAPASQWQNILTLQSGLKDSGMSPIFIIFAKILNIYDLESPNIILTPADFTDTGQWRLLIYISPAGMLALLKHISDASRPAALLFSTHWNETEGKDLLSRIENNVYDHPGLLDDYATDVIIETDRLTWIPNEILDSEDIEEEAYRALFPGNDSEIISDRLADCTAVFSLAPGLGSFLGRTLPGARLRSHMGILVENLSTKMPGSARIFADLHDGYADIIGFGPKGLLASATHKYTEPIDVAYRLFHLMETYGLDPRETPVMLSGNRNDRQQLAELLRNYNDHVSFTALPDGEGTEELPLAAKLLL